MPQGNLPHQLRLFVHCNSCVCAITADWGCSCYRQLELHMQVCILFTATHLWCISGLPLFHDFPRLKNWISMTYMNLFCSFTHSKQRKFKMWTRQAGIVDRAPLSSAKWGNKGVLLYDHRQNVNININVDPATSLIWFSVWWSTILSVMSLEQYNLKSQHIHRVLILWNKMYGTKCSQVQSSALCAVP